MRQRRGGGERHNNNHPQRQRQPRGERNEELFKIIRGNVRTPREVEGDLYAMASCNDVGGTQLLEFMREFGLDSIDPLAKAIIDRAEREATDDWTVFGSLRAVRPPAYALRAEQRFGSHLRVQEWDRTGLPP